MKRTVTFTGTREQAKRLIHSLIAEIPKSGGEHADLVHGIKMRVGMTALQCIQEDFATKSAGGTGADGIRWKELDKKTVAYSRNGGEPKTKPFPGQRGLLTEAENSRWRWYFWTRKMWFMAKFGMGEQEASVAASRVAWSRLKGEGARTKLDYYGNRKVPIGRINDRLFNSFSPGGDPDEQSILSEPPDAPIPGDRILRDMAGSVVVGSNLDYAERFHAQRPFWPAGGLPEPWQQRISASTAEGVSEAIELLMEGPR